MGASSYARIIAAPNEAEALATAREIIADDRVENGCSYSGSIGMAEGVKVARVAPMTQEQANDYAFETGGPAGDGACRKWGPALLIKLDSGHWYLAAVCAS